MTIDEAIAHEREVAKEKYTEAMLCHANPNDEKLDGCIECAREHEQLAEWLEKLKYIENIILKWNADWYNDEDNGIPDNEILEAIFNACTDNGFDIPIDEDCINGKKDGYNKAIDDFIHECDKYCGFYSSKNKNLTREDLLKIAKQLKLGVEDEQVGNALDKAIGIVKQGGVDKDCSNCANYTEPDEVDNGCYLCCKGYENNYKSKADNGGWIPCDERYPTDDSYILLSFDNFSVPCVGRYEADETGGNFYIGDEDETCVSEDLYVNAWQPLPEPYHPKEANYGA